MLTLCGFAASNYYNKVKLALLEKDIPFEEELVWPGQTDADASPLGKVPYLKTDEGTLSESTVILEYLEARYPQHPLLPADAFAAAKVRELLRYTELHLELVARNLYPEAFFGGKISDAAKEKTGQKLGQLGEGLVLGARVEDDALGAQLQHVVEVPHLPRVANEHRDGMDILHHRLLLEDLDLADVAFGPAERHHRDVVGDQGHDRYVRVLFLFGTGPDDDRFLVHFLPLCVFLTIRFPNGCQT